MNPARLTKSAALALGLLTVAWPLAWSPAWTYLVAGLGAAAVIAAVFLSWRPGPALAVAAAVVSCAVADAPVAVLAVEGLVILGYLLLIGAPPELGPRARGQVPVGPWALGQVPLGAWARGQVPLVAAGVLAGAAVLAAFAVRPSGSAWLALAGLAAAVAAYLVALFPREKSTRGDPAAPAQAADPGPLTDVTAAIEGRLRADSVGSRDEQ
jgi:hypothetical protein